MRVFIVRVFIFILIAATLGLAAAEEMPPSEWVARTWQTEDGLPQNAVNAIVQTRDGFLWVGTNGGLARFDGVRFRKFGLQDGLRSVLITALIEDRSGALWIGTNGGGVSRFDHGRITTFGPAEGFTDEADVNALAADRDGSVWIGTARGLAKWKEGRFTLLGDAEGLPPKHIRALAQDTAGTLWVSVLVEGLFLGDRGRFTRVQGTDPVPESVYSLLADRDGSVWAGAGNGLLWQGRDGKWKRFDPSNGLPKTSFESLAQSRDGTLWAGARGGGLFRRSGDQFERVSGRGEPPDQPVRCVTTDRDGSIWTGRGSGGLKRLSPQLLHFRGTEAGLPQNTEVTSLAEDPAGALWIAGRQYPRRFAEGCFRKVEDPAISSKHPIQYCAATTSDGAVWLAGEGCLYRFQTGQPTRAFFDPPIGGEAIRALCPDGDTLWLGTYYSTLLKCDAAGVQLVAPKDSFGGDITSIVREAADTLWIGTSTGLHRWEHGRVRTWKTRDGLLTASIRALHRDDDGTLWLGTLGGGLARMKNGRFAHITTRHGLVDDIISQIVADDLGCLWLGCDRGIMRVERRELEAVADGRSTEVHPIVFGKNEGMTTEQCVGGHSPTAVKTKEGRLLFPTAAGFAEIDPRRSQDLTRLTPPASIDHVSIDAQPQAQAAAITIPPGKHRIEVNYTAPALRSGPWVRFRYQLEGLDPDWVYALTRRTAAYEALGPGHYAFHVQTADGKGGWNEPGASVAIVVQPLFWQTAWWRGGVLLLLITLAAAAAWWSSHRRHLHRLAELERVRKQQAELAHASRLSLLGELSASLAHELKQPLAAILSNAQAAARFLDDDAPDLGEIRDILEDIAESDRRASEIITRMRAMLKKGETLMEPRDLNADIEQVLMLLRSELVTRNVAVDTQLAPDLPLVKGDHIQLQQVLLNLVVNGCDAMKENVAGERNLLIETERHATGISVHVTDCGGGIAPDLIEQIFEPFYSTKDHGLGMGLSICRAIVHAHGGRLWAANNPGRGATFHFTLPVGKAV